MAETSSNQITLTAEEVMELATFRYIDFSGVRVIDLEAPNTQRSGLKRQRSGCPMRQRSGRRLPRCKALQEYECAGGFSSAVGAEAADAALVVPVDLAEPTVGASVQLEIDGGLEAPPPEPAEVTDAPAPVAEAGASKAIVGEEASSPPRPVAADAESVEVRIPDEPAAVAQGSVAPKTATRNACSEI
jgi:hypothetical protein